MICPKRKPKLRKAVTQFKFQQSDNSIINMAEAVQTFGKKKVLLFQRGMFLTRQTATAVAFCKTGKGLIKVNGSPINLVQPEILRFKVSLHILIATVPR